MIVILIVVIVVISMVVLFVLKDNCMYFFKKYIFNVIIKLFIVFLIVKYKKK